MLWTLFITFFKIGLISFGGGYAMIPVIEREVQHYQWMSPEQFMNAVSLAGMAPGPIATNSATLIGYECAGLPGAIVSTLAMIAPSLIIIILIAAFFFKIHKHRAVTNSFYGLKPVVTGLIVYAAIHFGFPAGKQEIFSWHSAAVIVIFCLCLLAILRFRVHPLAVIACSALAGIMLFY
jgi:chromate transporter